MDPLFEKFPELQKKLKKRAEEHNRRVYNTIIDPNFHPNVDLTGQVFGHLHVLYYAGRDTRKENIYMCHCDLCENDVYENANSMLHLNRKSCGCSKYRTDDSESKLYSVFLGMNNRCYKKYIKNYDKYGGRGIQVCHEQNKFEIGTSNAYLNFRTWALENGYKEGLTIDRINNDGNYCPENCRWATHKIQNFNNSHNKYEQYGKYVFPREIWKDIVGLTKNTLKYRIENGWLIEDALLTPAEYPQGSDKIHISIPKEYLIYNKYDEFIERGIISPIDSNPEYILGEI